MSAPAFTATRSVAIRGLYAVTPDESDTSVLAAKVSAALNGGATLVQYRNKQADAGRRREQAVALLTVCRARGVRRARAASIGVGADSVAVISALFAASDVAAAARRIAAHVSSNR